MKFKNYHIVYFLGIGGIGMSALARWFIHAGYEVAGYDKTVTALTEALEAEGIPVHYDDSVEDIPANVKGNKDKALVVYTPAIPKDHPGYNYLMKKDYVLKKRSEVLGMLTENRFTIAVAGTHGKTTTSSMLAHILKFAGKDCTAFLGGISKNYNSNLLLNEKENEDTLMVVEADEFDRSFLTLHPNIAVVTSADADHLDIYHDQQNLINSFRQFIGQVVPGGMLYIRDGLEAGILPQRNDLNISRYALQSGDVYASLVTVQKDSFSFNVAAKDWTIKDFVLHVPGFHNVENAIAAIAVAVEMSISPEKIKAAMASYTGVKRRFEYVFRNERCIYIDDYAHHPVEIEAFLRSVKALYPEKKITAIFQPHLFTRTRDFAAEFSASLSLADEVILLPVYPAREQPIEGVTSEIIYENIKSESKVLCSKEDLLAKVASTETQVLVTLGAGDIDKFVHPIKEIISKKYEA